MPREGGRKNEEEERSEEYTDKFGRGHSQHEYPPKAGKFRNLSSTYIFRSFDTLFGRSIC